MGVLSRKPEVDAGARITTKKKWVKELTIVNKLGLHARPSALFVKVCNRSRPTSGSRRTGNRSMEKASWG